MHYIVCKDPFGHEQEFTLVIQKVNLDSFLRILLEEKISSKIIIYSSVQKIVSAHSADVDQLFANRW